MSKFILREWRPADDAEILRLNAESVHVLSPLDAGRLSLLRGMSRFLSVAESGGVVAGFLLGFTDGEEYDSVNYQWFSARLKQFLYIDRVVVSKDFRRAGLGRQFYFAAQSWARQQQLMWLTAEIDLQPPNPVSLEFHRQLGFFEVGQQQAAKNKIVSLQVCERSSFIRSPENHEE
jgi:predicted GNAT superfamily acetyltransferase